MYKQKKIICFISFLICLSAVLSLMLSFSISSAAINSETVLDSKVIVSMGDSFSSGEGIPEFYDQNLLPSEKVHSQDWLAHRSTKSWPGRLTLPAVTEGNSRVAMSKRRDTNWYFVASSGATTANINGSQKKHYNYGGQGLVDRHGQGIVNQLDGTEYINPQINVFDELGDKKVDYVTLTLGGNDVDFTGVITTAVIPHPFNRNAIEDKIEKLKKDFYAPNGIKEDIIQAYRDIYERATKNNPKVKIIVAGYPKLIGEKGSGALFSEYDAETINNGVVWFNDELAKIIQSLKDEGKRICFVPVTGTDGFDGKEAYASTKSEECINRLGHITSQDIDQTSAIPITAYSIHPNDRGAAIYARLVQEKINQIEKDGGKSEWPLLTGSDKRDAVLVLDSSSSMSGAPLSETKTAATQFVENTLYEEAAVGVVTYSSGAKMLADFNKNKVLLNSIIENIYTSGNTNIDAGLIEAEKMFENSIAEKKFIILMSDGEPNEGRLGEELINYANELKEKGLRIYTLGFFSDITNKRSAQQLMEKIANDGCHFEVDDAEYLRFFFDDIAEQIKGTRYQYIRIACPVDVWVEYDGEVLSSKDAETTQRTKFGTLTFEENDKELQRYDDYDNTSADNRIKVLRLKEGINYNIHIEGNGRGEMTYTMGLMDEEGIYSDMRTFENVRINENTKIYSVANRSNTTVLKVDDNGDGRYDCIYKAEENGKGRVISATAGIVVILLPFILLGGLLTFLIIRKKMREKRMTEASGDDGSAVYVYRPEYTSEVKTVTEIPEYMPEATVSEPLSKEESYYEAALETEKAEYTASPTASETNTEKAEDTERRGRLKISPGMPMTPPVESIVKTVAESPTSSPVTPVAEPTVETEITPTMPETEVKKTSGERDTGLFKSPGDL